MKSIAVITPKIDTFSNPTLILIFEKLIEENYKILFFAFDQLFIPREIRDNIELHSLPFNFISFFKRPKISRRPYDILKMMKQYYELYKLLKVKNKVNAIICIDPMGLVFAGRINRLINLKIIYASFEIFFRDEISFENKKKIQMLENKYSKNVDLVVVQDKKRESLLKSVNNFGKKTKFLNIPVSPKSMEVIQNDYDIYEDLNIPREKIIVVYSGTLQNWCGINEILSLFPDKWNSDFWFVIHSHYILEEENELKKRINELIKNKMNITFHNKPFYYYKEYARFLSKCDIGIAVYFPNKVDFFAGKNIIEIGLSSGKFSAYMMLGIPTITTSNSIYNELNAKYNYGCTINVAEDIPEALVKIKTNYDEKVKGCKEIFSQVLDPVSGIDNLIDNINEYYE
ncbi:MAG: hypothetical protein IPL53_10170 [Ignavibacteria bacterium]|nr:hypothetical protein [Ignavibacteria bacterium]